jgi:predicted PurR-regulated permease PerM
VRNPAGAWTVREWGRAALIAAAIAGIVYVVVAAFAILVPFLLGLIGAWILLPLVNWVDHLLPDALHRHGIARLIAIFAVYAVLLGLIVAFFVLFVPHVFRQAEELIARRQSILGALGTNLAGLRRFYETVFPPSVRSFIQQQFPTSLDQLLALLERDLLVRLTRTTPTSLAVLAGYIIVPFWLIYLLYDAERFRRTSVGVFPESSAPDIVNAGRILDDVAGAYLRGQVFVAFTVGLLTGVGLYLLGVNFALILGVITAIFDLIPTFGPIIAGIPTIIIALLESPILALWALLLIIGVREFEDLFVGPRVVGDAVRIRPAIIIILLLVAGYLWGFLGLLLIVPVTAALRDLFRYFYLRTSRRDISPNEALRLVRVSRRRA